MNDEGIEECKEEGELLGSILPKPSHIGWGLMMFQPQSSDVRGVV